VKITAVSNASLVEFLEVAETLHAGDPTWVRPLRAVLEAELGGASAFAGYGRQALFLGEGGPGAVGRVAALVNPRVLDASGTPVGQMGYFECVDDPALAGALFDAGAAWLRAQGCRELLAPMNGGAHRLHRLLVRGFERAPFLFEPRNPAYYPRLFEAWGMKPVHRWFTYELPRARALELGERFRRVLRGRPIAGHIDVIDPRDIPAGLARLHPLLDGFWEGHIGYGGLDLVEFAEVFAGALAIMNERNLGFYVENGKDLGCAFMYPDYVAEARALRGDASGWARWQASPKRLVMHTLALLPEARLSSAGMALMEHGLGLLDRDGYDELCVALVVEGLLGKQLGEPTREYALYGRAL
jgi:hypothetical protein